MGAPKQNVVRRFFSKAKLAEAPRPGMVTPCLEWHGTRQPAEYGQFWLNDRTELAHRVAWVLEHGAIPVGLCVLHRCDNPPCVRIDHLFLGTLLDNNQDKAAKGRQARGDSHGSRTCPGRHCGEMNGRAKLTDEDARRVFGLRAQGWTNSRIGRELGVDRTTISRIVLGKRWTHVRGIECGQEVLRN
jgi:hypothetical protein